MRAAIEHALASGQRYLSLMLPPSVGGHLEEVRQVVGDLLAAAASVGFDTVRAQRHTTGT